MSHDYFRHPRRFPRNVEGPFYTTGGLLPATTASAPPLWCGYCLACGTPEEAAPDLLAPLDKDNSNTYFVRQPETPEEVERACRALSVCCVAALRYGGTDRSIIQKLENDPERCDYVVDQDGSLTLVVDAAGDLLPYWQDLVVRRQQARDRGRHSETTGPWWQFWKRRPR